MKNKPIVYAADKKINRSFTINRKNIDFVTCNTRVREASKFINFLIENYGMEALKSFNQKDDVKKYQVKTIYNGFNQTTPFGGDYNG